MFQDGGVNPPNSNSSQLPAKALEVKTDKYGDEAAEA
jgi:hypothetical protein